MIIWGKVLVVDDSKVYGQLMQTLIAPYCNSVVTATGVRVAIAQIANHTDIELVLCDYVMNDGNGLEVLEAINALEEPKPRVIMVTSYPSEQVAERARQLGAVAYLAKPTTVRKIIQALRIVRLGERRQFNPRWRCSGKAHLLDDGEGYVIWDVYNISPDGAFLETKGPVPVGSEMELRLQLLGRKADVSARVVRIQEPSWLDVGGVGVEFINVSSDAEEVILGAIGVGEPEVAI